MTRSRWIAAALLVAILASLLAWQKHRERLMEACLTRGRTWNGPESRCDAPRMGPILRRSLERT
ncbi:MAG: hypothetical protein AB7O57_23560 [Hyphomicrobiaceae bacterium]